jgi:phosphonopyruvate decarboxylase
VIDPNDFIRGMEASGVRFVTGVPDSLLKDVCAAISNHFVGQQHIVATNEGSAVSMAMGHYLATGKPGLVYLQNSGLGNTINPIASLATPEVFGIPMILMIGWRGEISVDGAQLTDEPQHIMQGQVTLKQLELLRIPYILIDAQTRSIVDELRKCHCLATGRHGPAALVIRRNTFSHHRFEVTQQRLLSLTREQAISIILDYLPADAAIIATTGMLSRELFSLRKLSNDGHHRDFLTVGGMGHANQIAAGIAMARPEKQVICLDGDGAALMHLGGIAISADCSNLLHILINNESHDSVGGQPTKGNVLQFTKIAKALSYRHVARALSAIDLKRELTSLIGRDGSRFLEICCRRGARDNVARPDHSPAQNKDDFMRFIGSNNAR